MNDINCFKNLYKEVDPQSFDSSALELFRYQAQNNSIYKKFISILGLNINDVSDIDQIPFMPIEFFRYMKVKTGTWKPEETFMSSGTTSISRSTHLIEDLQYYLSNASHIFEQLYHPLHEVVFFALLPSYQEQGNSSLVRMVDHFIENSASSKEGGFFLNDLEGLIESIQKLLSNNNGKKICLFGVGYALLDLAELVSKSSLNWEGLTIIETGGMKGRRKDMLKKEFYETLKNSMSGVEIDSEYGMTELLSQAYSFGNSIYHLPHQMKVLIREVNDPFQILEDELVGGLNIIDLANVHSCAFIETKDLGKKTGANTFEVIGRMDNSDIRGCNLMVV